MADLYTQNTVAAQNQVSKSIKEEGDTDNQTSKKILFVGNSITRHGVREDIGWFHEWGMAASDLSKDYVHLTAEKLRRVWGAVRFATVNVADWERNYWDRTFCEQYRDAREYNADIVVIRFGENIWTVRDRFDEYSLVDAIDAFIPYFCPRGKENRILMTDVFWPKEPLEKALHAVAEKNGYPIVHIGDLGSRDDCKALGLFEHHGVSIHPGDLGMSLIADRIAEAILKL